MLLQQYMTGEQVVRIVGANAAPVWITYDKDYIKGEFDFEVEAGSTQPQNETFRRQSAMQLVDAMAPFASAGVVDTAELAKYVLQMGFGVKDPDQFINAAAPPPAEGAPPGQQQGALPAGPQPAAPPGGVPPGGPPVEQAPLPPAAGPVPGGAPGMGGGGMGGFPGMEQLPPEIMAGLQQLIQALPPEGQQQLVQTIAEIPPENRAAFVARVVQEFMATQPGGGGAVPPTPPPPNVTSAGAPGVPPPPVM
jgi:hypothetical protein